MYQLCMSKSDTPYIPFSQRNGLEPIPPQLKLGEASEELRRVVNYCISLEIDRETSNSMGYYFFDQTWKRVTQDIHVFFAGERIENYDTDVELWRSFFSRLTALGSVAKFFDFVEFLVRHPNSSAELRKSLSNAFVRCRAAYRIIDNQIVAIGTAEQAKTFETAISDAETKNASSARTHLIASGVCLRNGDWADSIRESIHAVEAAAIKLSPGATTLGKALAKLQESGQLHAGLRTAFSALYGYTSDEEGVRHALVFKDEPQVDETDALFMLSACASFVSYLLARSASIGAKPD